MHVPQYKIAFGVECWLAGMKQSTCIYERNTFVCQPAKISKCPDKIYYLFINRKWREDKYICTCLISILLIDLTELNDSKPSMNLISREELKEKLDRGDKFKLVNALGEWAFEAKRIPGSINIRNM